MTEAPREPTEELRVGRRALEGIPGCQLLGDFLWLERKGKWGQRISLSPPGLSGTTQVPAMTDWYMVLGSDYPLGSVGLYPAKEGGLASTFWHQSLNSPGNEEEPFREGNLCTATSLWAFRRHGLDEEPRAPRDRMRWHVLRAMAWLKAAEQGKLVRDGDPFELPSYPPSRPFRTVIGFGESQETFERWQKLSEMAGLVHLVQNPRNERLTIARRFTTCNGAMLLDVPWGAEISAGKDEEVGLWCRLREAPFLPPWQPPVTWRELWAAVQRSGVDPEWLLARVPEKFRDARRHTLLIGFPIPRRFGGPPERMHWLAVLLPLLSRGEQTIDGFRGPHGGWIRRDRRVVLDRSPLEWIGSENWAEDEISTRGRFSLGLRSKSILLIGAGALGSAVAELLVRGGVHRIMVLDADILQAGNLVRHSLMLTDVGGVTKAKALADWLNQLSPHARVQSLGEWFPPDKAEAIAGMDVVLDCTGDDDLLASLSGHSWPEEKCFASLSLGFHARRLFLFGARGIRFPGQTMIERLQPWLRKDREDVDPEDLPWEAIGCWHPVFPARIEDIRLFASLAVKTLDQWAGGLEEPRLYVFERDEEGRSVSRVQDG